MKTDDEPNESARRSELLQRLQVDRGYIALLGDTDLELLCDLTPEQAAGYDAEFMGEVKEDSNRFLDGRRKVKKALIYLKHYKNIGKASGAPAGRQSITNTAAQTDDEPDAARRNYLLQCLLADRGYILLLGDTDMELLCDLTPEQAAGYDAEFVDDIEEASWRFLDNRRDVNEVLIFLKHCMKGVETSAPAGRQSAPDASSAGDQSARRSQLLQRLQAEPGSITLLSGTDLELLSDLTPEQAAGYDNRFVDDIEEASKRYLDERRNVEEARIQIKRWKAEPSAPADGHQSGKRTMSKRKHSDEEQSTSLPKVGRMETGTSSGQQANDIIG